MTSSPADSYREVMATLSPPAVSQYLAAHEWELEARDPEVKEIWRLPGEHGPRGRIMLPLATDYVDFPRRFQDTIRALASIYDWDPAQLVERVTAARADLFFVRLDQEMVDGTIPIRQAESTLESVFRMLRAAATTAADPTHSHRGRRSATVTDYLDQNVRLGHTKRGSFVFTVVSRLGDPPVDRASSGDSSAPFPRTVMTTLVNGLSTTRRLALRWDERALDHAAALGLSSALVESVQELTQSESLRSVDLSFDWAAAEPPPRLDTSRIIVDRDTMAGLSHVRERLVRREEPRRHETLLGLVRTLSRDDGGDDDQDAATSIILSTHVDGRPRKVHVPLGGDDYELAIGAHRSQRPIAVSGDLMFERGAWRLYGAEVVAS